MALHGRRKIFTQYEDINEENILLAVNRCLLRHLENIKAESYLYWYRRGKTPIENRVKEIRPEICNKINVGNADQVVTFWNGYFMTAPSSYSAYLKKNNKKVRQFNDWCKAAGKDLCDSRVVDFMHTVGVCPIYVHPNMDEKKPFSVWQIDPRSGFVAYSLNPGNRPMMGVNMVVQDDKVIIDCYTERQKYTLMGSVIVGDLDSTPLQATANEIISVEPNVLGVIPIVEYQYNECRMSAFENALDLMDEVEIVESNRADAIEQAVQELVITWNCNFEEGTTQNSIRQAGMINLRSQGDAKADFKVLGGSLNLTATQTTLDSLYEQILDKTGLPSISRGTGGSSDNGSAVYLRSGYAIADTKRRNEEDLWKESDMRFREVALAILRKKGFELDPSDFGINIEPPTVSNLLVKTQSAMNMRQLGLAPEIWLERSGLSNDPLKDIEMSKDYIYKFYDTVEKPAVENEEGEALADTAQSEDSPTVTI